MHRPHRCCRNVGNSSITGVRVPMIVVSPWSKGGWVNSQVFDHASLIQFIEKRFHRDYPGLREENITAWRRAVCGDLTSSFNFKNPNDSVVQLPSTVAYVPPDNEKHPDYTPPPPSSQAMPVQEPSVRPARAVPYKLHVRSAADFPSGTFEIRFANSGKAAAVFQVRSGSGFDGPWTYTVGPHADLSDTWALSANRQTAYDLSVYGPNGFLRVFKGSISDHSSANLDSRVVYDPQGCGISLDIYNRGAGKANVHIADAYTGDAMSHTLQPRENVVKYFRLERFFGWYDFTLEVESDPSFTQRLAGHLETGEDSMTDPTIAAASQ